MIESNFPSWLMKAIRNRFFIQWFVESGTWDGATAVVAASMFSTVHTIEISKVMFNKALPECRIAKNLTRHLGSSVEVIPQLLPSLTGPTLWYLDGHWAGQGPKLGIECPVVQELELIRDRPQDVVVVDDARLFDAPPGPPHDPEQWPTTADVVAALRGTSNRFVVRWIDLLIASSTPLTAEY